jgi:hypothetical protein
VFSGVAAEHMQKAATRVTCFLAVISIGCQLVISAEETNAEIVAKLTALKKSLVVMKRIQQFVVFHNEIDVILFVLFVERQQDPFWWC